MFQDYKYKLGRQFPQSVNKACLAQNGTLLLQTRKSISISHLQGCVNSIQLLQYFKQELNMNEAIRCSGLVNIRSKEKDPKRCCFGLAINQNFWLAVVGIISESQHPIKIQLEIVMLINLRQEQNSLNLRLIDTQTKGKVLLQQITKKDFVNKTLNIVHITSYESLTGKLNYFKMKGLKFAGINEEESQKLHQISRANLLYQIFEGQQQAKLFIYNQLVSPRTFRHSIYVYNLTESAQNQIFAERCLTLPSFDDEKLLKSILPVSTEDKPKLQLSYLFLIYQLPDGLEIVQTQFQAPNIILRKCLYPDINFVRLIQSSITPEEIYLKGIQNCIQNHTILIQTSKNVEENHYLTLLSLPSTGNAQILNDKQIHSDFQYLKHENGNILLYSEKGLITVEMISKHRIYENFIQLFIKEGVSYLNPVAQQILQFFQ